MTRDLGDAFDAVERPAPALIGVESQIVQTPVNRVWSPLQVASELNPRQEACAFAEVPVLQLAPRLLPPTNLDPRRGPGLAKRLEVSQHAIKRRVWSSHPRTTAVTVCTGDLVPLF